MSGMYWIDTVRILPFKRSGSVNWKNVETLIMIIILCIRSCPPF